MITRSELEQALGGGAKAFIHPDEMEPLARYAAQVNGIIVEIGTGYGACAALMLSVSRNITVTSIDPFERDSMGNWQSSAGQAFAGIQRAASVLGFEAERWTLLQGYSYDVVADWVAPIDLLFIDGDHSYLAVRRDWEDWLPHVTPGGLVLLHDSRRVSGIPEHEYEQGWPGPTRLANELRSDARVELVEEVSSLTIWRKAGQAIEVEVSKPRVRATKKEVANV